jgi:uncharacterized protein with PQ loop repeat
MEMNAVMYTLSGIVVAAMYLPQITSVWRCEFGANSISLLSWCIWSCASIVSVLYATQSNDQIFQLVSALNCLGCLAVFSLSVYKRNQFKQQISLSETGPEVLKSKINDSLIPQDLEKYQQFLIENKKYAKTPSKLGQIDIQIAELEALKKKSAGQSQ